MNTFHSFKHIFCLFFVVYCGLQLQAQEFVGVTPMGGENNTGSIIRFLPAEQKYETIYSFPVTPAMDGNPFEFTKGINGKYYGIGSQVFFEWDPATSAYRTIKKIDDSEGYNFDQPLLTASDGTLYGMTWGGFIYTFDPSTGIYNTRVKINEFIDPEVPFELKNGKYYGFGLEKSSKQFPFGRELIYEWDPKTDSIYARFHFPYDVLFDFFEPQPREDRLYGHYSTPGNYNDYLFEWDPETDTIRKIYDLKEDYCYGCPHSLVKATNGKLYMSLPYEKAMFEYDPQTGKSREITKYRVSEFGTPPFSLVQAGNGKIYGITGKGLLEWNIEVDSFVLKDKFKNHFSTESKLSLGTDNCIYGSIFLDTYYDSTIIFKWDYERNLMVKRSNFSGIRSLEIRQGDSDLFYGISSFGGPYEKRVIYSWNSSNGQLEVQTVFNGSGYLPVGPLWSARNGKLYGTAGKQGKYGNGIIYEFNPVTLEMTKKKDIQINRIGNNPGPFWMESGSNIYGITMHSPNGYQTGYNYKYDIDLDTVMTLSTRIQNEGQMIKASNGKFYEPVGDVIYECDPNTETKTEKWRLNSSAPNDLNGYSITNPWLNARNGKIYGITKSGGINGYGVIFEWDPLSEKYTKVLDVQPGKKPKPPMVQVNNDKIYAFSDYSVTANKYALFEVDLASKEIITKLVFDSLSTPGYLTKGKNGKLYGELIPINASVNAGKLFEWDPETEKFTILHTFSVGESMPQGFTEICDHPTFSALNPVVFHSYTAPSGRNTWTKSGTYEDILPNAFGCDSIITINLNVLCPRNYGKLSVSTCDSLVSPSGKYKWKESGVYHDTIPTIFGCDSIITIDLFVPQPSYRTLIISSCDSLVSPSGKYTWKESGVYHDTIPTIFGCDSIITINLIAHIRTYSTFSMVTCDSLVSPSGKYTWKESGVYHDTIPTIFGCDSIITINLIAHIPTYSTISMVTCDSLISPSGKYTWRESGIYKDTIPNAMGCDSVITINLDKTNVNTDVIIDHQNLTASAGNGSYQWLFCQEGLNPIPGATSRSYRADQPGSYALIVQQDNCIDTSACYDIVMSDVEVNSFKSLSYYPNPSQGSFTVDLGKVHAHTMVTVTSAEGRIVYERTFKNERILDMDVDLPPALYIVNVNSDKEQTRFKIQIK